MRDDSDRVRTWPAYITAPQGKNHRVGEVFISNCISVTPMMAAREMLTKQLLNARAKSDKTYHMLVSFKLGEEQSKEILRKIESALCARLGFGQPQSPPARPGANARPGISRFSPETNLSIPGFTARFLRN